MTGAHGFIGSHLVEELVAHDWEVRALLSPWGRADNLASALARPGPELVRADITQPESLRGAFEDVDVVFHAAARVAEWGPWEPFYRTNVEGTRNVLRAAEQAGVRRLVLVSSVAVHRFRGFCDADPRVLPRDGDVNAYARSKVMAEEIVEGASGLEPVIVRPGLWPFGPRDRNFVRQLEALRRGLRPLVNGGRARINTAYVENLVLGLRLAGEVPGAAGRAYLVADEGAPCWRELMDVLAELAGAPRARMSL
ncbi:MAG TPA: NAD(P)H-binding protein, partial [Trueperaceae bacterium]